jgi:hypothetical protein
MIEIKNYLYVLNLTYSSILHILNYFKFDENSTEDFEGLAASWTLEL